MAKLPPGVDARARPMADGSGWYVELAWPDGRIERIGDFGSHSTVRDWISREFASYFRSKLAH